MKDLTINYYNGKTTAKGLVILSATEFQELKSELSRLNTLLEAADMWIDDVREGWIRNDDENFYNNINISTSIGWTKSKINIAQCTVENIEKLIK